MVPEGWEAASLGQLVLDGFRNGFSPNAPEKPTGRYVLALSALAADGFNEGELKLAPDVDAVVRSELRPGDFLISRSNTRERVGFTAMFRGEVANCSYPDLMMRFRPKTEYVVPEFLEQQLRSRRTLGYLQGAAAGTSASMVKLNSTAVSKAPVWLPPLPEQRKIAEILGAWDRAIEVAAQQLETARTQKRALMQQLLTGTRRFPEFEGQPWKIGKLVDHFDFINGRAFKPEDWGSEGLPIIRIQNLTGSTDGINHFNGQVDEKHMVRKGDFLLSWSATLDTFIWAGEDAVLNQHIFKVVPQSDTLRMFGFHLISFEIGKLVSKVHGTSMKHITKKDLSKITSAFPSIPEQERITEFLNAAQREIDVTALKINHLRTEKKALMQQLLTGKRRVAV